MLEARRIVRHDVSPPRDELDCGVVSPFTLHVARFLAQVTGSRRGADRSLLEAADRRGVVSAVVEGGVAGSAQISLQSQLREHGGLLEVAVGDAASRIVVGHESVLHLLWERLAPEVGASLAVVDDSPHPCLCGVRRPRRVGSVGYQLGEARGA